MLELIAVLAIAGVLLTLTAGAALHARERAQIAQARAELAALAQALENYRALYGDFPQTGGCPRIGAVVTAGDPIGVAPAEARLFNALLGRLGPRLQPLPDPAVAGPVARTALATPGLALERSGVWPTADADAANAFLDPWGRRYQYCYRDERAPATWTNPAFVLYSVGPDGVDKPGDPTATGTVDYADPRNADNLYASRD